MIRNATHTVRVDSLFQLLQSKGQEKYFSQPVTHLEHALQTAHFVERNTSIPEVIIAALLHDIGHLIENPEYVEQTEFENNNHDFLGAAYLKSLGFRKDVTYLVANHVRAKRYLVTTDPAYRSSMSEANKQTFMLHGGSMWPEEIVRFESDPNSDHMILIELCDEIAKKPGLVVATLENYRPLLESYLEHSFQITN